MDWREMHREFLKGIFEEKRHLEDVALWMEGHLFDWSGLGKEQVEGSCEHGNEIPGSIKFGEFLDWLKASELLAPEEGFFFVVAFSQLV